MSGSNLAKYGEWKDDQATADREEYDRTGNTSGKWKVPLGTTDVRFAPPRLGKVTVYRHIWEHWLDVPGEAPGSSDRKRLVCPLHQAKQDALAARSCPSCSYADRLRASGTQADYELAGDYIAKRVTESAILVRGQEELGWQVWPYRKSVFEAVDAIRRNPRAGGNFTHPVNGFDLSVTRTGSGKNDTKYSVLPARHACPLVEDAATMDQLLESIPDLDVEARILPHAEVLRLWERAFPQSAQPIRSGDRPPPRGRAAAAPPTRSVADDVVDTTGHEVKDGPVAGVDD